MILKWGEFVVISFVFERMREKELCEGIAFTLGYGDRRWVNVVKNLKEWAPPD
jgi:hypothetical protein